MANNLSICTKSGFIHFPFQENFYGVIQEISNYICCGRDMAVADGTVTNSAFIPKQGVMNLTFMSPMNPYHPLTQIHKGRDDIICQKEIA